ncbi:MAG: hypothetical protein HY852_22705 [Bradyrhizobium sp.]|uniref:hypothetical protein n=1 Tax=Bradyrhizobium sp. TaxID=376 RepID=UPI0025C69DD3|nr:hypothetical protein [Bradyrhizobium sp.]MBI5264615.1 hypothetical protein [Bradyrhizobium sp.]
MTTSGRKRKLASSAGEGPSGGDDPPGEGGPDEAVAFIAETVVGLRKLAERHSLDVLHHLLGMVQLEAEERLRLRSKRKLS